MASLLLAIIYLAFISLGLPDSLLGSAWPEMHNDLGVSLSSAGIITMLISVGTTISSLFSDRLSKKFSTGIIVTASTALTLIGLFGFSVAPKFWVLCVLAIPYGLGAGSIDAALNNYVALHYTSRDMSWLHCFWGVGTIISPYVMSYALGTSHGWSGGYRMVGAIQLLIFIILVATLPLWKKVAHKPITTPEESTDDTKSAKKSVGLIGSLKIRGVPFVLLGFFGYCGAEATVMLWSSTYFFGTHSITEELAAALGSLFFIGMTVSRFLSGFVANRLGDKMMIRLGLAVSAVGVILTVIPNHLPITIAGFLLIGLGYGPIYPSIIHSTPSNFGEENSQAIIGIQMAAAYLGSTFMPPLFGLVANHISIRLMPLYLALFMAINLVMIELLWKRSRAHSKEK